MIKIRTIQSMMLMFAFVLTGGWAAAVLVDNFETYTPGDLATVGAGTWTVAAERATIAADAGNQFVTYNNPVGGWAPVERALPFNVSSQATLFFRIYLTAEALDHAVGLTDNAAAGWYDQYAGYVRFTDDTAAAAGAASMDVRNGGAFVDDIKTLTLNQWYNVWLVFNPTAGTFDVYCNQSTAGATSADLARAGNGFRKAYANPLVGLLLYGANAANARVDDVYLSAGSDLTYPLIPTGAHNPTPGNGAANVLTTATLSWTTGVDPSNTANPNPAITKHYISFRKGDPNLAYAAHTTRAEVAASGATGSWAPPTAGSNAMAVDGTYYWRVDESVNNSLRTDPNTIIGSTWSFLTQKSIPEITQQPAEARAFATDPNAVFTCKFTSLSPASATWYKYVDGVSDTALSNGGDNVINTAAVGNTYTSTLLILTPADADQGNYYCKANNGTAVSSNTVALVINRLLAQYDFNSSFAPTPYPVSKPDAPTGQGKSVAGLTEPNSLLASNITLPFVTGFDGTAGGAVVLDDPDQYIDFGTTGYPKAGSLLTGIGSGLDACTILCWVKPDLTTHSLSVVNSYNDNTTTAVGFSVETNKDVRINARGEATEILTVQGQTNRPGANIFDGNWHLIGVRWDAKALTSAIYVDGQWVTEDTTMGTPAQYAAWQRGLLVGAGRQSSPNRHLLTNFFSGAIDKLRVYNYLVPANEIAKEYYDATGVKPCINMTFQGNGYNFDNTGSSYCAIDITDLMLFITQWQHCGIYPLEECP